MADGDVDWLAVAGPPPPLAPPAQRAALRQFAWPKLPAPSRRSMAEHCLAAAAMRERKELDIIKLSRLAHVNCLWRNSTL